LKISVIMQ